MDRGGAAYFYSRYACCIIYCIGRFTGNGVTNGSLDVKNSVNVKYLDYNPLDDTINYAHDKNKNKLIMVSTTKTNEVKFRDYPAEAVVSDSAVKENWRYAPTQNDVTYVPGPVQNVPKTVTDETTAAVPDSRASNVPKTVTDGTTAAVPDSRASDVPRTDTNIVPVRTSTVLPQYGTTAAVPDSRASDIPTYVTSKPVESGNTVTYVVVGIVVLALLGGGAYFMISISTKAAVKPSVAKKKGGYFDIGD